MLSIWMVRAEKNKHGSCTPGQQGETQIPGKLAGQTQCSCRPQKNGTPAKDQALGLEWGMQNGGDFGPKH